ncbi:hypothetical protein GCM10009108_26750 [Castellaniella ginsengisoli]|uniref:Uncharacterized protein n=1 Tax=Castellaniella ginsengisoli TaxID=546114 RepID=A0ABN1L1U2_9BURK
MCSEITSRGRLQRRCYRLLNVTRCKVSLQKSEDTVGRYNAGNANASVNFLSFLDKLIGWTVLINAKLGNYVTS